LPHKFILGQTVAYTPPRGSYAPPGIYVVIAKLSERDDQFEYYIKLIGELYERIAKESELREVRR
jgi:hypothetical protein